MTKIFVKPSSRDLKVPRAAGELDLISADGEWVESTIYIARRIGDGSLAETDPPLAVTTPEPDAETQTAETTTRAAKRKAVPIPDTSN